MGKTSVSAAVALTSVALLAAIAASETGYLMLTQAEGEEIVNGGFAVVDMSIVDNGTAAVRLTEAGVAELAKQDAPAPTPVAKSGVDIDDGVPIPASNSRRARDGKYPFANLEIGQSFHVAKTAKNENPVARLASSVSGARIKFSVESGETETVTKKTYERNGKSYVKDAEGKRIVVSTEATEVPKLKLTRDFVCKSVGADDPKGEGARVWRVELTA